MLLQKVWGFARWEAFLVSQACILGSQSLPYLASSRVALRANKRLYRTSGGSNQSMNLTGPRSTVGSLVAVVRGLTSVQIYDFGTWSHYSCSRSEDLAPPFWVIRRFMASFIELRQSGSGCASWDADSSSSSFTEEFPRRVGVRES